MGRLVIADGQSPAEFQREVLLDALHELYVPARREELQAYATVFAGGAGDLPPLSEIVADESNGWHSGSSQAVVLCPALVGSSGQPDDGFLTRSDWKIENRLVNVGAEEGRHLWLLRISCDHYMIAEDEGLEDLAVLSGEIRKHAEAARSRLSGDVVSFLEDGGEGLDIDSVEELREAAENSYSEFAERERPLRRRMADRLANLSEQQRLFGA